MGVSHVSKRELGDAIPSFPSEPSPDPPHHDARGALTLITAGQGCLCIRAVMRCFSLSLAETEVKVSELCPQPAHIATARRSCGMQVEMQLAGDATGQGEAAPGRRTETVLLW